MQPSNSVTRMKSSFIREILAAASNPNMISLAGGLPDEQTFPLTLLQPTIDQLTQNVSLFQYGPTQGYEPLVEFLPERYDLAEQHKLLVNTGSQQGLDLIARAFINPGDTVVMEAPSYLGAMQVFDFVQANILTVPQTDQGPDLKALEQCFSTQKPTLFYAVPDFHNPTGVCWSLDVLESVAALCLQYGVTLVEDAPYRDLRFTGSALPMVSSFCQDKALVLRSFSKIAAPGLRIGLVSGPREWGDYLIKVKQGADLHSPAPTQAMLLGLLTHPEFEHHAAKVCDVYRQRYQILTQALSDLTPLGCSSQPISGGMFVWLNVPECDTFQLAKSLIEQGVATVPSDVFYPKEKGAAALRLNFTNATPERLNEAVGRMKSVLTHI